MKTRILDRTGSNYLSDETGSDGKFSDVKRGSRATKYLPEDTFIDVNTENVVHSILISLTLSM